MKFLGNANLAGTLISTIRSKPPFVVRVNTGGSFVASIADATTHIPHDGSNRPISLAICDATARRSNLGVLKSDGYVADSVSSCRMRFGYSPSSKSSIPSITTTDGAVSFAFSIHFSNGVIISGRDMPSFSAARSASVISDTIR